jgi:hypothetical protein
MEQNMFTDLEKNIIIMALMYMKNDYTPEDLKELGLKATESGCAKFEDKIQTLIEDFVGPTWDEEGTLETIKRETANHSRNKEN